ncbi:hypothetical protein ACFP9U_17120, partial [Nitratireductor sp. GCM10026969]
MRYARTTMLASFGLMLSMPIMPVSAQNSVRPILSQEQCLPLSEQNYAICCVARNRAVLLSPAELDQCPPITTSQVQNALNNRNDGGGGVGGGVDLSFDGGGIGGGANPGSLFGGGDGGGSGGGEGGGGGG